MIYTNYPNELLDVQGLFILLRHVNYLDNGKIDECSTDPKIVERIKSIDASCAINRWIAYVCTRNPVHANDVMKNIIKSDESILYLMRYFGSYFRWSNETDIFDVTKKLLIDFIEFQFPKKERKGK